MNRLKIIPLFFLVAGASMGLLLRWHLHSPITWLKFPFWLHAHSHMLTLGWAFNALLFVYYDLFSRRQRKYRAMFMVTQIVLVAMTAAFVVQGYGLYSIALSSLHLGLSIIYLAWIYQDIRGRTGTGVLALRISLLFSIISAIGPLSIGPLSAMGMATPVLKSYLVHFYLHFQFNGTFLFGVIAIIYHLMDQRSVQFNERFARWTILILAGSIPPSYFLTVLSIDTPPFIFAIAFAGAVGQLAGIGFLIANAGMRALLVFKRPARYFIVIAAIALGLKSLFQLAVIIPDLGIEILNSRTLTVAYLHLILVGFVTSFLLGWYEETFVAGQRSAGIIVLYTVSFAGLEVGLTLQAFTPRAPPIDPHFLVMASSVLLWLSFTIAFSRVFGQKNSAAKRKVPVTIKPDFYQLLQ
jgi:hypothetical protein